MKLDSVADVLNREDGDSIEAFTGIVDAIYERNEGNNQKTGTTWTLQELTLKGIEKKQEKGVDFMSKLKLKVKLWNQDALPMNAKGKQVWIHSPHPTAILVTNDPKKGKSVSCAKGVVIEFEERKPAEPEQEKKTEPAKAEPTASFEDSAPPTGTSKQAATQAPQKTNGGDRKQHYQEAVRRCRERAGKVVNAHKIALRGMHAVNDWHIKEYGLALPPAHLQAIWAGIVISMEKSEQYLDCIAQLPPGDMTEFLPKKEEPAKEPEKGEAK